MNREQTLPATCEQTVTTLTTALAQNGYRIERSFDLRSALHDDCPCPHHGTTRCACQYVVLLVYAIEEKAPPAMVTAHECDGITRLHMEAGTPGEQLAPELVAAVDEALSVMLVDA